MPELAYPDVHDAATEALKLPPYSVEAEQSVLGGLMIDNGSWDQVADLISEVDFYRKEHRLIYRAIAALAEEGQPSDAVTLSEWLDKHNELQGVGGLSYLGSLAKNTPTAANIKAYANIVRERSIMRQLVSVGTEIANSAYNPEGRDSADLLEHAEQKVFEIAEQGAKGRKGYTGIKQLLTRVVDRIDQLFQADSHITGVPTGFDDFDDRTAGLQPSDLVIIAGRPSMGKCLEANSEIVLEDGSVETIETIYRRQHARLFSLCDDWRLRLTTPSNYVDDGKKPVFRVRTGLGREIETTATHPYLTPGGWRPLAELAVGERLAVPRKVPVFGRESMRQCEVKLLAYLIGDGSLTQTRPKFTNVNRAIQKDFLAAIEDFDGVRAEIKHRPDRAADICVAADEGVTLVHRFGFARWLRAALSESRISQRRFAHAIDASPASVHYWTQGSHVPGYELFSRVCRFFSVTESDCLPVGRDSAAKNSPNALTLWLDRLGVWGKTAHEKSIPAPVFRLPKDELALFINRLFSTDGWATVLNSGQAQLGYTSASERLMHQLQHLLLRFGVVAKLRRRNMKLDNKRFPAWQMDITDAKSIRVFADEIGIYGKEKALGRVIKAVARRRYQTNRDLIPLEFWHDIARAKGDESWAQLARRAGISGASNMHVGKRALSRARLGKIAAALADQGLQDLASSDVYWDRIVSIEPVGMKQVYDLSIPDTHNFVANDICVHNTTFAMNIAENAAIKHKIPVAVFSMEMPGDQLAMRMMSSLGHIDQHKLRTGKLQDEDWPRVTSAVGILSEAPLYIDDTPALSPIDLRARARRLKREHGLGLIIIDYLQLMQSSKSTTENRATEISEISRSLKALAKELSIPVIALSQLNRSLEQRPNKRPVMSDLRESGAIEQDADVITFIYRDEVYNEDSPDKGTAEIIIGKQRNGPIGTVRLTFMGQFTRFENFISNDAYAGGG